MKTTATSPITTTAVIQPTAIPKIFIVDIGCAVEEDCLVEKRSSNEEDGIVEDGIVGKACPVGPFPFPFSNRTDMDPVTAVVPEFIHAKHVVSLAFTVAGRSVVKQDVTPVLPFPMQEY